MRVRSKEGGGHREAWPAGRSDVLTLTLDVESLRLGFLTVDPAQQCRSGDASPVTQVSPWLRNNPSADNEASGCTEFQRGAMCVS